MRTVYAVAFAAALALVGAPVAAQTAPPRIAHQPANGRPYSAAVQVGDTYWLSGKVGGTAETRNIMEAFKTLLTELGMDFGDVVQGTVYLADIDDYGEMNAVYGEYFPTDPPARETVAVSALVGGAAVEISFIAVKR